jgi:hypothetical protein
MKYPNEYASHVASVDVISRHISPTGEIITDRLLQLKQPIPSIIKKIGISFPEVTYFLERSTLNRETLVFQAKSYSLSLRSIFRAREVCTFSADPESGGTVFVQEAEFTAFSFFSKIIETAAVNRFHANAAQGRMGLESVLENIGAQAEKVANDAIAFEHRLAQGLKDSFHELESSLKTEYRGTLNEIEKTFDSFVDGFQDNLHNPFI